MPDRAILRANARNRDTDVNATIATIDTLACGAGWRNYYFVKLTTSDGVVGWSEYDEGFGNPGIGAIIAALRPRIVGRSVAAHERLYQELRASTRPATGGVIGQALGAIENALLDAKAKTLGVPCYELLGGCLRDRVQVYWSHCATWRISRQPYGARYAARCETDTAAAYRSSARTGRRKARSSAMVPPAESPPTMTASWPWASAS